ncbi:four-carbon acid sugar kinase family protein [Streptomyces cuspidosporus]|uniref:4-hydroxythreonine-4-phosphate dehydrogenase n=1 Tax=Streptomyces cuspidosporus TaxID=66882 RepID=A0ABN3GII8_9ACTN
MTSTTPDPSTSAPPGPRFVVLADDLTSAAEAAGHLADTGRAASVVLDLDDPSATDGDSWPCVDLDSRHLPPDEAALRHRRATTRLLTPARSHPLGIYKTMDSSLRGNWPAELAAVMRASGRSVAVVAPACPAYGRHTVGGHQYAGGVPVHRGPAGRDPVRPVADSSVLAPLSGEGLRVTAVAPTADALAAGLAAALASPAPPAGDTTPGRALVVDAATNEDLDRIAAAVAGHLGEVVLCGSPGLWEAVVPPGPGRAPAPAPVTGPVAASVTGSAAGAGAASLAGAAPAPVTGPVAASVTGPVAASVAASVAGSAPAPVTGPVAGAVAGAASVAGPDGRALVLVGSRHPTTREQLDRLGEDGVPVLATTDLAGRPDPAGHLTRLLGTHSAVALTTPEALADGPEAAARHLRELASLGAACARALPGLGLVLSGGDTAREVCEVLGAPALHAVGTLAPGIPLGVLSGARPHPVISKAGGFGDPETLIAAVAALTRRTA